MFNNTRKSFLILLFIVPYLFAQSNFNHTFPKTAIFTWTGAVPDWYAKFDLCMTRHFDKDTRDAVKALNPDVIWLPARDFNVQNNEWEEMSTEWYARTSTGERIEVYGSTTWHVDWSDLAIPNSQGDYLVDAYTDYLADLVYRCGADGISTDGFWTGLVFEYNKFDGGDVDLDRNGVNDYDEHGKAWVAEHWGAGCLQFMSKLRSKLGESAIILLNVGHNDHTMANYVNGIVRENCVNESYFGWYMNNWNSNYRKYKEPYVSMRHHWPPTDDPYIVYPTKNDFSAMRSALCRTTVAGQYFTFEESFNIGHYWNRYYDEFDLDIGYPTTEATKYYACGDSDLDGLWVRFFDHGVVMVNMTGSERTITASELAGFEGYNGPYYRFKGGQDPTFNTGEDFDQVTLRSIKYNSPWMRGDGIILVDEPQTVVADIIIDNSDSGTSPGSGAAELTSGWNDVLGTGGGSYFTVRVSSKWDSYAFASVSSGSGSETATFRPVIGVAGLYEVFEWHAYIGSSASSYTEATNMPVVIKHATGTTNTTLDLSQNYGQWNSLGVYSFTTGNSLYVRYNNNTDGPVVADAVKFVYLGDSEDIDTTPPSAPQGVEANPE